MYRIIIERPQHAIRIAAIAAEWTQVEKSMVRLLAGSYGRTLYNEDGPRDVEHHPVAVAAMEAAETMRARFKLLDLSLGKLVAKTTVEPTWTDLRKQIEARGRERNKVVHGSWGLSPGIPNDLVMQTPDGYFKWTVTDFDATLDRIVDVRGRIISLTRSVMDAVHSGEIKQGVMGPQSGFVAEHLDGSAGDQPAA
ncbi:hypothetical protein EAH79_16215 [Sphingomonas koreensis]|nr:hypothetical protein EAH79_16215 [Sphingomonas koreensis]